MEVEMRKIRRWVIFGLFLLLSNLFGSEYEFVGNVINYEQSGNQIDFFCVNALVKVTALTDDIVRIRMFPNGRELSEHSYSVLPINENFSLAPVENFGDELAINTKKLEIIINKQPFRISFYDKNL